MMRPMQSHVTENLALAGQRAQELISSQKLPTEKDRMERRFWRTVLNTPV